MTLFSGVTLVPDLNSVKLFFKRESENGLVDLRYGYLLHRRTVGAQFNGTTKDWEVNPESTNLDRVWPTPQDQLQKKQKRLEHVSLDNGILLYLPEELKRKFEVTSSIVRDELKKEVPLSKYADCVSPLFQFHDISFCSKYETDIIMDIPIEEDYFKDDYLQNLHVLIKAGETWTKKRALYKELEKCASFHLHEADFIIVTYTDNFLTDTNYFLPTVYLCTVGTQSTGTTLNDDTQELPTVNTPRNEDTQELPRVNTPRNEDTQELPRVNTPSPTTCDANTVSQDVQMTVPKELENESHISMEVVKCEGRIDIPLQHHDICVSELFRINYHSVQLGHAVDTDYKSDMGEKITIALPFKADIVSKRHSFIYTALIKVGEKWTRRIAKCQAERGIVSVSKAEYVILVAHPKTESKMLTPKGLTYTDSTDTRKQIKFPKECVKDNELLHINPLPVNTDVLQNISQQSSAIIVNMSDCIYVEHDTLQFLKPIEVQLPLMLASYKDENDAFEMKVIHVEGRNIEILDMKVINKGGNVFSTFVTSLSGISLVQTRKCTTFDRSTWIEMKMAFNLMTECKILSFINSSGRNKTIRVECIKSKKVKAVVNARKMDGLIEIKHSRSSNLYLYDAHRFTVYVRGVLQFADKHRKNYSMIYLRVSNDNHIQFRTEVCYRPNREQFGIIEFNSSNFGRNTRHIVHFDVESKKSFWKHNIVPEIPLILQNIELPDDRSGATSVDKTALKSRSRQRSDVQKPFDVRPKTTSRHRTTSSVSSDAPMTRHTMMSTPSSPEMSAQNDVRPKTTSRHRTTSSVSSDAPMTRHTMMSTPSSPETSAQNEYWCAVLEILEKWRNNGEVALSNQRGKFKELCYVFHELNLSNYVDIMKNVFRENRAMRRSDFQNVITRSETDNKRHGRELRSINSDRQTIQQSRKPETDSSFQFGHDGRNKDQSLPEFFLKKSLKSLAMAFPCDFYKVKELAIELLDNDFEIEEILKPIG